VVRDACLAALPNVVFTDAIGASETGFTGISFVSAGSQTRGGPTVMPGPDTVVIDDQGRRWGRRNRQAGQGGHVPLGYYKDPVKTAAMYAEVDGERFVVPGDWARVEEDGSITLLGRATCPSTRAGRRSSRGGRSAIKEHPTSSTRWSSDSRRAARAARRGDSAAAARADLDLGALEAVVRRNVAGYKCRVRSG